MKWVLFLVVATSLTACQTTYQPHGMNGGYAELQIAEDVYEIRARGNEFTNDLRTRDLILLRASDLALQNGYSHFAILSGGMESETRSFTTPGRATTTASASVYGNHAYGSANTVYTPPQTIRSTQFRGVATVKMLRGPSPGAFDADLLYKQLHPKLSK